MRKKRELYTYTESEVKAFCWKLINSFTNKEDVNIYPEDYKEDFERWFKQNKKRYGQIK